MNSGSLLSFQVCDKYASRPNARQIREMAVWLIPVAAATDHVNQCASWPEPRSVSVLAITSSACSSVIVRSAPGRGASPSPISRSCRHPTAPHAHSVPRDPKVSGHRVNDDAVYMLGLRPDPADPAGALGAPESSGREVP